MAPFFLIIDASLLVSCVNSNNLVFLWYVFNIRRKLFDKIKLLDETLLQLNDESLLTVLLFGSKIYNEQVNVQILNTSIDFDIIDYYIYIYIIDSDRSTDSLI